MDDEETSMFEFDAFGPFNDDEADRWLAALPEWGGDIT